MKQGSTAVPNILFDFYLSNLKETELKVLLTIIRQTLGWVDYKTKKRKNTSALEYIFNHRKWSRAEC